MRCTVCRDTALVEIRRHNSGFCRDHFLAYFENQVRKAIDDFTMFGAADRILVAVSGGKDSLALWDVLLRLGYHAEGLYIGLGIDDYSDASQEQVEAFAAKRGAALRVISIPDEYGSGVKGIATRTHRAPCSACGLGKRYTFNRIAAEGGYDVICTGHNMDDEAAALFGNLMHWQTDYLARQSPLMEAEAAGLVRKAKPLYRLSERETAAYCVLRGINYQVEECPMALGNKTNQYKELLNEMELKSPGTKHHLLFGFLERAQPFFRAGEPTPLRTCDRCGEPTTGSVCSFCRMIERAGLARREECDDVIPLMAAAPRAAADDCS
jgi:uncharacterized protein (TIGR00269 family)